MGIDPSFPLQERIATRRSQLRRLLGMKLR
jgi:hypothetical protein